MSSVLKKAHKLNLSLSLSHSRQGPPQQGAEWGVIKAINPLFSTAFEATFDKLQLIRTTLISKMIKLYKTNRLCLY